MAASPLGCGTYTNDILSAFEERSLTYIIAEKACVNFMNGVCGMKDWLEVCSWPCNSSCAFMAKCHRLLFFVWCICQHCSKAKSRWLSPLHSCSGSRSLVLFFEVSRRAIFFFRAYSAWAK